MSRLKFPLKEGLRDPADEPALSRMWQAIDARFPRRRSKLSLSLIIAPAAAMAAGIAVVAYMHRDAGPLRLANGSAIVAVDAPATGLRLAMSDGSSVELGAGARFEPIESSAQSFIAVLDRGDASFEVKPGGPRRWQIECGLATIEVVGTRFSCARGPDRLHVGVEHGVVLVRGERVPNRARRLSAGESLDVLEAKAAPAGGESADSQETVAPAATEAAEAPALAGPAG